MTGSQRRKANRQGNVLSLAQQALAKAKSYEDCTELRNHRNIHVRLLAIAKSLNLPHRTSDSEVVSEQTVSESTVAEVVSEFESLVQRFRTEGKKDPIKSARASLAATAKKRNLIQAQV